MSHPRQTQQQQQQQQTQPNNTTTNNKKKKSAAKKTEKCDQHHKDLRGGAGDGGSFKPKKQQQHTQPLKENRPLQASMEQLQFQMQSIMSKSPDRETKPQVNISRQHAGSNWNSRRNSLEQQRECGTPSPPTQHPNAENNRPQSKSARLRQKRKAAQRNKYVAIDCEMVGVGMHGQDDMLARVSVVNKQGDVLLDKFVKPRDTVTDYRTSISGIRPNDIEHGEEFNDVQDQVVELLQGKILVGHAIRNDLAVLHIKHPYKNIRDTSRYKPLCRLVSNGRTPSLKRLSQAILGLEIQTGEHNSVEDARAAMRIYNRLSGDWEKYIQKQQRYSK